MERLIIECPNGKLEYCPDILMNSPYIKKTLIDKHFFGSFGKKGNPILLNFDIKIVSYLIDFIRIGKLDKLNKRFDVYIEMLEYLNAGENDSLLSDGIDMLKNGYLDQYGIVHTGDVDLNNEIITINTLEERERRKAIVSDAVRLYIRNLVLNVCNLLTSSGFFVDNLFEDHIMNSKTIFDDLNKDISSCLEHTNQIKDVITSWIDNKVIRKLIPDVDHATAIRLMRGNLKLNADEILDIIKVFTDKIKSIISNYIK